MRTNETTQLIERIFRFNKLMHEHMSEITGRSASEMKMLCAIEGELKRQKEEEIDLPGVNVSKISEHLMNSKPATSKMLNLLEDKGEVERIYSKKDRRTVYINITDKGRKRTLELQNHMYSFTNLILEGLGEEKTNQLFEIMDSMYNIVKEYNEGLKDKNNKKE